MITADTITDEQIRELRSWLGHLPVSAATTRAYNGTTVGDVCASALNEVGVRHSVNEHGDCARWCNACRLSRDARARCAEILNVREQMLGRGTRDQADCLVVDFVGTAEQPGGGES